MQTLAAGLDQGRRRLAISLTPLIDIVFILVVFFMLASTFQQRGSIDLTPPGPAGAAIHARLDRPVILEVMGSETFKVDGHEVTGKGLVPALRTQKTRSPEPRLRIRVGENARLQDLVTVFDGAAQAGLSDVALAPERPEGAHE